MKRLFIGTFIDNTNLEVDYDELIDEFNENCQGKWVELENLHFTYKFLGDTEESMIPDIKSALSEILVEQLSTIEVKGLDVFPRPSSPRVLIAKILNEDNTVNRIQKRIESLMKQFGFDEEKRRFIAHLTLLRIKSSKQPGFRNILAKYANQFFLSMPSFKVNLIESELTKSGPIYRII